MEYIFNDRQIILEKGFCCNKSVNAQMGSSWIVYSAYAMIYYVSGVDAGR